VRAPRRNQRGGGTGEDEREHEANSGADIAALTTSPRRTSCFWEVGAAPKDGLVEVSVSDTGVGIAPEDQEKVFEEFRQVGTAAKKVESTGLGLTLCRKFVELHGGRIWVKSREGVGSTFTFTIPVRRGR